MLIFFATLTALTVFCALVGMWGHAWRERALYDQRAARKARQDAQRASHAADHWRARAERLLEIVDRVERS